MAIVRWNPWNASQLSQFFDDNFPFDINMDQTVRVDVAEDANNVYVKLVLPGFNEDDIRITIEGSTLTVKADAKEEKEENTKRYYRREISNNSIVRSITLPTAVSSENAGVDFDNGILTLTLPKAEEAKPKEIDLKKAKK